jgi:D-3-phosphoglycerate dehydrogenase
MKVLVNKPIHSSALQRLEAEAEVLTPFAATYEELVQLLPDIDGLLLCAGFAVGQKEIALAPKLRVIGRHGVGLDNVDLQAATAHGVPVVYTPFGPTESTAEHAFLLMLAAARHLPMLDRATRAGNFGLRDHSQSMGIELRGKLLGVVGFGRIGRRLAQMCQAALEMTICVYDPYVDPKTVVDWGATPVDSLVELARQVDVLSLHIPATVETHHLVNDQVIAELKPSAILVNAARGDVLDQAALALALSAGRIHGAGLDVYSPEPPAPDNPLFQLDRIVLTPHVASKTYEARTSMGLTVVDDILSVLNSRKPKYLANPKVWQNRRSELAATQTEP